MNRSRVAVLSAGLASVAAAVPATAPAATVEVRSGFYKASHLSDTVRYRAQRGERNDLVVTREGSTVVVTDTVPITAGRNCASETDTVVRCSVVARSGISIGLDVALADGDDTARLRDAHAAQLAGGKGDDLLLGLSDAGTSFTGGTGRDRMVGGTWGDTFKEGTSTSGSDTIVGGSALPGASHYSTDHVLYHRRRTAVYADLEGDRDDGAAEERDQIGADVEAVSSGRGPDRLYGGPGPDRLDGGDGRPEDRLFGGPGDDALLGGAGADRIAAGSGRDWIDAGPGADRVGMRDDHADVAQCGLGIDAADHDGQDFLLRGCERQGSSHPPLATPVWWNDTTDILVLRMACPSGRKLPCEGQVAIDPGAPVPRSAQSFSLRPGSLGYVYLALEGRTSPSRQPPLEPAFLDLSSTDPRGRVVDRRIPLRDVPVLSLMIPHIG